MRTVWLPMCSTVAPTARGGGGDIPSNDLGKRVASSSACTHVLGAYGARTGAVAQSAVPLTAVGRNRRVPRIRERLRVVTVVSSRPHPPSPATRDAHSEDADREARKRKRERARTAQYLRPAHVLGTSAVGRAEWQYGRTARCTPGPPGVNVLGQADFGALFG